METQTPFSLFTAIENWRRELAVQPGFTAEDRRELETHLQDSIAELRHAGLSDEEAFWLSRRRMGIPRQLNEEFLNENPARGWRERLLWIVMGVLLTVWGAFCLAACLFSAFFAPVYRWFLIGAFVLVYIVGVFFIFGFDRIVLKLWGRWPMIGRR
jgi:hypothetical protein